MRIQHNIAAMNSYRNYNNNVAAVNKNLEKLSSGYKINRAGDDAAGLAISEKMRAQITGLEAAQKNVKDGISLVKTAEGAMQEIQDMLNRMDYLATQSANGTYDNDVDRANLQKEVENLKTEINRIADSANFNGIKLLDGSLDSGARTASVTALSAVNPNLEPVDIKATKGEYNMVAEFTDVANLQKGDKINISVEMENGSGKKESVNIELTAKLADDGTMGLYVGDKNMGDITGGATGAKKDEITAAVLNALQKDSTVKSHFTVTNGSTANAAASLTNAVGFEAKTEGTAAMKITDFSVTVTSEKNNTGAPGAPYQIANGFTTDVEAVDDSEALNLATGYTPWNGSDKTLEDSILEIGGKKFAFIDKLDANGNPILDKDGLAKLREAGVENWVTVGTDNSVTETDIEKMVKAIRLNTGLDVEQGTWSNGEWTKPTAAIADSDGNTYIRIRGASSVTKTTAGNGGLMLQIGDTSDSFNQMKVSVGDMHTNAMGTGKTTLDGKEIEVKKTIADIDISNQTGAAEAIGVIKNAINYVSSIRGDLGAVQNRLEHTANNLSVMRENIQDAESTIRDTDIAEEMMSYTKNNILVQSAQAMLAQANQIPQGVLQLLG